MGVPWGALVVRAIGLGLERWPVWPAVSSMRPGARLNQEQDLHEDVGEWGLSPLSGKCERALRGHIQAQPAVHHLHFPPDFLSKATSKFINILPRKWSHQGHAGPRLEGLCPSQYRWNWGTGQV